MNIEHLLGVHLDVDVGVAAVVDDDEGVDSTLLTIYTLVSTIFSSR